MDTEKQLILDRIAENRLLARSGNIIPIVNRRNMLDRMLKLLLGHREGIFKALNDDLGKSEYESITTELMPLTGIIHYLIDNLAYLTAPKRLPVSILNWPARAQLLQEPYGEVLIGATWNYPLLLTLEPLAGAIAAGNYAVVKLAERAPRTMHFLNWLIEESFSGEVIPVGDEMSLQELLEQPFDYIFFTGGSESGKRVLAAAAPNLTPVTLELGGKNPCIVAPGCNLKTAARRIVWGKFTNAGQTCVAPDYLVVHTSIKDELMRQIHTAIQKFYGETPLDSPDYPHLIDSVAYERISRLAEKGRLVAGGDKYPEHCAIEPTVVDHLEDPDDPLLNEEIFGPILPVVEYETDPELLAEIRRHGKPLALYCFGGSRRLRKTLRENTSSGALVFNDVVMHFINPGMPFGGVGASGMGAYHGKLTFQTFSHAKPEMSRGTFLDFALRYPPYPKWLVKLLNRLVH